MSEYSCWRCGLEGRKYDDGHSCIAVGETPSATFSLTAASGAVNFVAYPVQGICPKHGEQREKLSIRMEIPEKGDYCQQCWCEEIARTCQRLTPPSDTGDRTHG